MTKEILGSLELNRIYQRDCLEGMRMIPDKSVDLSVIDPPYNIGKDKRWDKWKTVDEYVAFMTEIFKECERVLKPNGSFYWWHNDFLQIVELQRALQKNTKFVYKQLITISKPKFKVFAWKNRSDIAHDRNWFPNVEYCLFYTLQEESFKQKIGTGLTKILMSERFSVLQDYFKIEKEKTGLNYKELDELMGVKASFSYWDKPTTHPYRIPKKQNYSLLQNTGYFQKPYQEVESLYLQIKKELDFEKRRLDEETWTEYIKERYTFNKSDNISCVWEFDESNSGKYHPTQKPISLIEKIIKASSNEGDIVLDCFMGSGTTAVAAVRTGRKFIGFEREPEYVEIANRRLDNETEAK